MHIALTHTLISHATFLLLSLAMIGAVIASPVHIFKSTRVEEEPVEQIFHDQVAMILTAATDHTVNGIEDLPDTAAPLTPPAPSPKES
jgi:hypothetical protein